MSSFPYTHLLNAQNLLVAVSGPYAQCFDSTSFDVKCSQKLSESGPVRCCAIDNSASYLATTADDKNLSIWDTRTLSLVNKRELPKKATSILFTADSKSILVSDKFGDVFSYPLFVEPSPVPSEIKPKASHENPSNGALILGHVSVLTSFLLSQDERFILTADRDEHIRVSHFPNGYNIEMFCLGHTKFISALHIPLSTPSFLISGGGDPCLKMWNWLEGNVIRDIEILEALKPYIRITPSSLEAADDAHEDGPRPGRRRKRNQGGQQDTPGETEGRHLVEDTPKDDSPVLVVHKIHSLDVGGAPFVVLSAVGCSALLGFSLPLAGSHTGPEIVTFDFKTPILDFTIHDDEILVSLDHSTSDNNATQRPKIRQVKLMSGKFEESPGAPGIVLNTANQSFEASPADIRSLQLYVMLSSMPKRGEVDPNAMDVQDDAGKTNTGSKQSKKELGRLKSKFALDNMASTEPQASGSAPAAKKLRSDAEPEK